MSGLVGMINLDGAPIDRTLLQQLTQAIAYRGPDRQEIWCDGPVGLGHTLLRTTYESLHERQPCSLDGQVWITADARIDGRSELIKKLNAKGCQVTESSPDVDLILSAYRVWGSQCVDYLLGDFAFAIWDSGRQQLFCARDHFGVKPFYYAQVANHLIFSNTLNCIRRHPAVSNRLNDLAIADFLLFSCNYDLSTTVFAEIQSLPPAHYLTWTAKTLRINRYWSVPVIDSPLKYRHKGDYIDHFRELLNQAVADRLRTDSVGVFMSGGLDSPAVAATARELLAKQASASDLQAYTAVYDRLIPDQERYYSGLAATALDIPIHYLVADDYRLYERWNEPEMSRPCPTHAPLLIIFVELLKQVTAHHRVVLTGWDGDSFLNEPPYLHFVGLLKKRQVGRFASDIGAYILSQRQLPPLGLRTNLKRLFVRDRRASSYPTWLNQTFAARLDLPTRWNQIYEDVRPDRPMHHKAYRVLNLPTWISLFEDYDPGVTLASVEFRHPLLDLRLIIFLLSMPVVPWCIKKSLIRTAMRSILPEPICLRPKSPLAGDPVVELIQHRDRQAMDQFEPLPVLAQYIDKEVLADMIKSENAYDVRYMRSISLNHWLRQSLFNNS
ncbi:MAG TPA: asparagine synthase-related protein [Anaerolineae bacterium]|nr:asparagine synthase-related protein [Anaerolineae bacterium]